MGMEKFCNIKCRVSGLTPDAVVIVATTRALKMHGGGPEVTPGKALHETYTKENLEILREGCKNLLKHIENSKKFRLKVLVGINKFSYGFPPWYRADIAHPPPAQTPPRSSPSSKRWPSPVEPMLQSLAITGRKVELELVSSPLLLLRVARCRQTSNSYTISISRSKRR